MDKILLHGNLHVTISEASSVSRPNRASGSNPKFIRKFMDRIKDTMSMGVVSKGTSMLYTTIDLDKTPVGITRTLTNEAVNPRWYESFRIYSAHLATDVTFTVKSDNATVGRAYLPVQELLNGDDIDTWLQICSTNDDRKKPAGESTIHVKLQFLEARKDRNWARGVRSVNYPGVPHTFFSQRNGCKVTLYQDAHVPDDFVPRIHIEGGKNYEIRRCWEGIFDAITNAQHLVYITGWSMDTDITLIRDTDRRKPGANVTLGELLKKKAIEGVRVLMLVSDDHQNTADYFHGTDVRCVLCPGSSSVVQDRKISTVFTHHQEIVCVDSGMPLPAEGSQGRRRIVSFVGGLASVMEDTTPSSIPCPGHMMFIHVLKGRLLGIVR